MNQRRIAFVRIVLFHIGTTFGCGARMTGNNQHDVIEVNQGLTPGEQFQNWLSRHGIGEAVRPRDLYQPEPPPGLWILVNGATAIVAIGFTCYFFWLVAAHAIPALVHLAV